MIEIRRSKLHPDFGVDDALAVYVRRVTSKGERWRPMKARRNKHGYRQIKAVIDFRLICAYEHVLICEYAHGDRPSPEHEVRHLNGVRDQNAPSNLCWGTRAENAQDRARHGTQLFGERGPRAKLSTEQIARILAAAGSQREIAASYGVSQSLVSRIRSGLRWRRHVLASSATPPATPPDVPEEVG